MLWLFDENVIYDQADSSMSYNVRTTYWTYINKKNELLNKMLLHNITPNSNTH